MKKLVGEMSDLLNKIVKFSDDYADVKDIFLNDSTMELAEDAIGSLKFLNNSRKALSIIKFKYFLKGLNYENADKESIEKAVLADERSLKWMEGKSVVKIIIVPKKNNINVPVATILSWNIESQLGNFISSRVFLGSPIFPANLSVAQTATIC